MSEAEADDFVLDVKNLKTVFFTQFRPGSRRSMTFSSTSAAVKQWRSSESPVPARA